MITTIFLKILRLSLVAGVITLAVLLLRLCFRKAPRWLFCAAWGLVALRLLLPFTVQSPFSILPKNETVSIESVTVTLPATEREETPEAPVGYTYSYQVPVIRSGIEAVDERVNPILREQFSPKIADTELEEAPESAPEEPLALFLRWAGYLWLAGAAAMLLYAVGSHHLLHRRLREAVPYENDLKIRQAAGIDSPFILGILRPVIYLPAGMDKDTAGAVIAHEKTHLRRGDHLLKPLGFLLLGIYWFNPLLWIAYAMFCRDIEFACDEKVVKSMEPPARRLYAEALLSCGIGSGIRHRYVTACPLAFGEVSIKERVKKVMHYKKPAFWIILAAAVALIVTGALLLTSPLRNKEPEPIEPTSETSEPSEPSEPSETSKTSEPSEPSEPSKPSEPSETSEPSEVSEDTSEDLPDTLEATYSRFKAFYELINTPNQMTWEKRTEDGLEYAEGESITRELLVTDARGWAIIEKTFKPVRSKLNSMKKLIGYAETIMIPELAAKCFDFCECTAELNYLEENGKLYSSGDAFAPMEHNLSPKFTVISEKQDRAVLETELTLLNEKGGSELLKIEMRHTEKGWRVSGGSLIDALFVNTLHRQYDKVEVIQTKPNEPSKFKLTVLEPGYNVHDAPQRTSTVNGWAHHDEMGFTNITDDGNTVFCGNFVYRRQYQKVTYLPKDEIIYPTAREKDLEIRWTNINDFTNHCIGADDIVIVPVFCLPEEADLAVPSCCFLFSSLQNNNNDYVYRCDIFPLRETDSLTLPESWNGRPIIFARLTENTPSIHSLYLPDTLENAVIKSPIQNGGVKKAGGDNAATFVCPAGIDSFPTFGAINLQNIKTVVFREGTERVVSESLCGGPVRDVYLPKSITHFHGFSRICEGYAYGFAGEAIDMSVPVTVHYAGSEAEWKKVDIGTSEHLGKNVTVVFHSTYHP